MKEAFLMKITGFLLLATFFCFSIHGQNHKITEKELEGIILSMPPEITGEMMNFDERIAPKLEAVSDKLFRDIRRLDRLRKTYPAALNTTDLVNLKATTVIWQIYYNEAESSLEKVKKATIKNGDELNMKQLVVIASWVAASVDQLKNIVTPPDDIMKIINADKTLSPKPVPAKPTPKPVPPQPKVSEKY